MLSLQFFIRLQGQTNNLFPDVLVMFIFVLVGHGPL